MGWDVFGATFAAFPDSSVRIDAAVVAAGKDVPAGIGQVYDALGNTNDIQVVNFSTVIYFGPINVATTIARIQNNQSVYQNEKDDGGFFNFNPGELPNIPRMGMNYYMEFMVWPVMNLAANTYDITALPYNSSGTSSPDTFPGPERILVGSGGEVYYTGDHYSTDENVNPTSALPAVTVNSWNNSTGNWTNSSNWALSHVPANAEAAYLSVADEKTRTVNYDYTGGAFTLSDFLVNADGTQTSHGSMTFQMSQGGLVTNKEEVWARYATATVVQTAGSMIVNGPLHIGSLVASAGTYNLSGGYLSTGIEYIGSTELTASAGTGVFNQTGGIHYAQQLNLGYNSGGTGVYNLQGGTYNLSGGVNINAGGTFNLSTATLSAGAVNVGSGGVFNWISGNIYLNGPGTSNFPSLPVSSAIFINGGNTNVAGSVSSNMFSTLYLSGGNLSTGKINLTVDALLYWSAGNLSITAPGSDEVDDFNYVATNSTLSQVAGSTLTFGGSPQISGGDILNIACSNSSNTVMSGGLSLYASKVNMTGGTLILGSLNTCSSSGALNWTGGTLHFTSPSGYTLPNDGSLPSLFNIPSTKALIVDGQLQTTGTMNLSGGTLLMGNYSGPAINWTSGTLGFTGTAGFTVNAVSPLGANVNLGIGKTLLVTNTLTNSGTINLSGGTLTAGKLTGTAPIWSSGAINITGSSGLTIGSGQVFGSSLTLTAGQSLDVVYALTNNGTVTVNGGSLIYGFLTGNPVNFTSGSFTVTNVSSPVLVNGSNQAFGTPQQYILVTSTGSVNASNGAQVLGSYATNGNFNTSSSYSTPDGGYFNQAGGTTTVGQDFKVGALGTTGTALLTTGNFKAGLMELGSTGGSGSFTLGGPGSVGLDGLTMNDFTENAGDLQIINQIPYTGADPELVGAAVGGYIHNGGYYLNGGTAEIPILKLGITAGCTGVYQQTGGVLTLSTGMGVGYDPYNYGGAGIGIANLYGGITNTPYVQIGSTVGAVGTLNVSTGAQFNVSGQMLLVTGNVNQSGGTINAGSLQSNYAGVYQQSGGTTAISGDLQLGFYNTSSYLLYAGNLTVGGTLYVGPAFTSTFTGTGIFNQTSGTIAVGNGMQVGEQTTVGQGVYTIANDAVLTVTNGVGVGAVGYVNQAGGTVNIINGGGSGSVFLAGVYNLSGGLLAPQSGVNIGGSNSLFLQTGGVYNGGGGQISADGSWLQLNGTANLSNGIVVGTSTTTSGRLTIAGGGFNVTGYISLATGGSFNVNGGTVAVLGSSGNFLYNSGSVLLQSGDLQAGGEYLQGGMAVSFVQAGGTQEISSFVSIAPSATDVASYQVSGGTLTTNSVVVGASPFYLTTPGGAGSFTLGTNGVLNLAGSFTNFGTVVLAGTQNYSSGVTFTNNNASTATFITDAGAVAQTLTLISNGGLVNFNTSQHLAAVTLSGGTVQLNRNGSTPTVLITPLLTGNSGQLNLTTNGVDVQGGSLASVRAMIVAGNIISSTAINDTTHLTTVGVLQNNQSGSALFTSSKPFDGITPGAGDILAKYTYYGDANLSGKVDGSDYSLIDSGFLTHATGWYNGDFNYDGIVNGSDYTLIDNAFNTQSAQLQSSAAPTASITAQVAETSTVPEPAAGLLVTLAGLGMIGRRRIRNSW